ncbi:hypothetical protein [Flavobacterium sp. CF136]|uniref:hypothetical protein n=1 Tax=Flavobacterium sp. (strain CF136) TaxID=1144313 RepID=UPI0002719EFF|nr:hypothetical protein [Flavobacterium sp. CF136]EJL66285.1 hypothetical protein PMI10_00633 [Flavobacterium sp. CF136]
MEFIDGEFEYEGSELENMEMPTPCQKCGEWFDLHTGYGSKKWFPKTTICSDCHELEEDEIDIDEEISDLKETISDAEDTISTAKKRLKELADNGHDIE